MGEILVGGLAHPCAISVESFHASGLRFEGLPMREVADFVVLDWTGNDFLAPQAFKTIRDRRDKQSGESLKQSVHFFVDHLGRAYQHADALSRVSPGIKRTATRRGVCITVSNRADANRSVRGIVRELVKEQVNDELTVRTAFTAPQVRSTVALVEALCSALQIPVTVPRNGAHVIDSALPELFLESFRGVLGAFHLDSRRQGPGLSIMRAIAARPMRGVDGAAE